MFSLNWMWVELNEIKIAHENIISKHSDCRMFLWHKFLELHHPVHHLGQVELFDVHVGHYSTHLYKPLLSSGTVIHIQREK